MVCTCFIVSLQFVVVYSSQFLGSYFVIFYAYILFKYDLMSIFSQAISCFSCIFSCIFDHVVHII